MWLQFWLQLLFAATAAATATTADTAITAATALTQRWRTTLLETNQQYALWCVPGSAHGGGMLRYASFSLVPLSLESEKRRTILEAR